MRLRAIDGRRRSGVGSAARATHSCQAHKSEGAGGRHRGEGERAVHPGAAQGREGEGCRMHRISPARRMHRISRGARGQNRRKPNLQMGVSRKTEPLGTTARKEQPPVSHHLRATCGDALKRAAARQLPPTGTPPPLGKATPPTNWGFYAPHPGRPYQGPVNFIIPRDRR